MEINKISIKLFIQKIDHRGQSHDGYLETDMRIFSLSHVFDFILLDNHGFNDC